MPSLPPALEAESVRVVVQARPLLPFEAAHGAASTLSIEQAPPQVRVARPLAPDLTFSAFDAVYHAQPAAPPDDLYDAHVAPLVDGLFLGLNATVFAYGQTSAGKSYTMRHVTQRVAAHLFARKRRADATANVTVRVGFVEIYRERIRDLVDGTRAPLGVVNVQVRERRPAPSRRRVPGQAASAHTTPQPTVFLDGAREKCVTEERDLLEIIREGTLVRQTASTAMNASSSRSHSIITITVQQEPIADASGPAGCLSAKLHLVDLAGSERAKRTAVVGDRFAEGVEINKGLFALAKVISTLADNASRKDQRTPKAHVPYRDSKLTRLLQDSLGGNARTLLVACVSPADTSREETLGTLRYAERAKCIKNKPKVNTEANSVEVSDLRASLARAKAEIAALAAENERLRRWARSYASPRRLSNASMGGTNSGSTDAASSERSACTDTSQSPQASPREKLPPVVVVREDDEVTGLKYRIAQLEGMLERTTLNGAERQALRASRKDTKRVMSTSPLGKLRNARNVGLAALSSGEPGDARKKPEPRAKACHGPRRRMRATKPEWSSTASLARRVNGVTRTEPVMHRPPARINSGLNGASRTDGGASRADGGASRTDGGVAENGCYKVPPNIEGRGPQRVLPFRPSPPRLEGGCRDVAPCELFGSLEEDGRDAESNGTELKSDIIDALSSSRLDEIRRTFTARLEQAESDKGALDKQRVQLTRQLVDLQKKHDKEVEEIKASHHVRVAGMRSKLADVKRIEAESTRLIKLRDGSDAARKKLVAKVKATEKARDELATKLADAVTKADCARRTLGKENRDLAKSERLLRAHLRKLEMLKSRHGATINRLRMENEAMKGRLREAGRQHVRRANSGITPSTVSRTAC